MSNLQKAIINIYEITAQEAEMIIYELRRRIFKGENPEELLYEIGLEPDYIEDLIY